MKFLLNAVGMAHRFMQPKLAEKIESVALSHQTVERRIDDMGEYVSKIICDYIVKFEHYVWMHVPTRQISDN